MARRGKGPLVGCVGLITAAGITFRARVIRIARVLLLIRDAVRGSLIYQGWEGGRGSRLRPSLRPRRFGEALRSNAHGPPGLWSERWCCHTCHEMRF